MQDYETGRHDLGRRFGRLNGAAKRGRLWLPMGSALARASLRRETRADLASPPEWQDLSRVERRALEICWQLISGADPEGVASALSAKYLFLKPYLEDLAASITMEASPALQPVKRASLRLPEWCDVAAFHAATGQGSSVYPHHHIARLLETNVIAETRFGARRAALPEPDGYALRVADADIAWLAQYRDAEFWHLLLPVLVARTFDPATADRALERLSWILAQPDCDTATATAAFLMLDGPKEMPAGDAPLIGYAVEGARQSLADAVAARAASGFYAPRKLSLASIGLAEAGNGQPAALPDTDHDGRAPLTPFYHDEDTIRIALL